MKQKAFTLIELLVVFSLIGIIIGISLVAFGTTRKTARDGKRKADLEQIRSALEMYRSDVGNYPPNSQFEFGESLVHGKDVYMETIPYDPLTPTYTYVYDRINANSYNLCAFLETGSGTVNCGSCGEQECNYKVTNP